MQAKLTIDKGTIITSLLKSDEIGEIRSVDSLAADLDDLLRGPSSLTSKELALALFHATKGAQNGRYGENPEPALDVIRNRVQPWTDRALKKNDYSSYTIAHMFDGFSRLGLRPPERFITFALDKTQSLISKFNRDDVTDFAHAIAHLGILPNRKILTEMSNKITSIRGVFSPGQLHSLMRSLAILDCLSIHHNPSKPYSFGTLFSELLRDQKVREKLASTSEPNCKGMLSDAILWFKGTAPYKRPSESDTSSLFESDVANKLRNIGATVKAGVPIQTPNHTIDLSATFGQVTFFVECDGPTHFVHGADDHKVYLNGPTIFQTALIHKKNADTSIIRIPIDVFYQKISDQEFWEDFLVTMDDAKIGAYCLAANGKLLPLCNGRDQLFEYT